MSKTIKTFRLGNRGLGCDEPQRGGCRRMAQVAEGVDAADAIAKGEY